MQELKDVIGEMIKNGGTEEDLFAVIAHIDNTFLEKEKKQIIKIIEDSQQIDFWDKYKNEEDYVKLQLGKTSDEEIEKSINTTIDFIYGAKWMKEQILGKEDKTFKKKSQWTKVDNMTRQLK